MENIKITSVKYELEIEFRGKKVPQSEYDHDYYEKKFSFGTFENRDDAVSRGNEIIKLLAKHGYKSHDDFNSKLFGIPNNLVTNIGFLPTFFLAIRKKEIIDDVGLENLIADAEKNLSDYKMWAKKEFEN